MSLEYVASRRLTKGSCMNENKTKSFSLFVMVKQVIITSESGTCELCHVYSIYKPGKSQYDTASYRPRRTFIGINSEEVTT